MPDVYVDFDELNGIAKALVDIAEELGDASADTFELQAAVGRPFGRSELCDEVYHFDERWWGKRKELTKDLGGIKDSILAVVETFTDWDTEAAKSMEVDASATQGGGPGGGYTASAM